MGAPHAPKAPTAAGGDDLRDTFGFGGLNGSEAIPSLARLQCLTERLLAFGDLTDLERLLLACRLRTCEALAYNGAEAALLAVVDSSLCVAPLVVDSDQFDPHFWSDSLWELADDLRLVATFGPDAVTEALATGPRIYSRIIARAP